MNPQRLPARAPSLAPWWLLWVAFVVYGSLVPLEYRPLDWAEALARFRQIPMLDIGLEGRADWIANGVLFVPVGFLTTAWLAGARATPGRRLAALLGGIAFGAALAVAVEFTQLFFPQRTVSRNDILAEWIGSVLGALLAWRWSDAWRRLLAAAAGAAWVSSGRLLTLYGFAYVALAFFPYDLLVSMEEVAGKVDGGLWGWWLAPAGDERALRRLAQLAAEILTVLPLGWLWARRAGRGGRGAGASVVVAAIIGAGFGLAIESAQFFVASGVSQGASVLSRATGFMLAAWLWNQRSGWTVERLRSALGRFGGWFVAPYVLAAMAVSGWFAGPWRSADAALARLLGDEVRFVPFYHHYFGSESAALFSATSVALLYAPVGVLVWARHGSATAAALAALGMALLVEAGKLFPAGIRPDPTNVWIAMACAAVVATLLSRLSERARWSRRGEPGELEEPEEHDLHGPRDKTDRAGRAEAAVLTSRAVRGADVPASSGGLRLAHGVLAVALAVAVAWLAAFPVATAALGALLIACTALVWWRPVWLFALVPAALPLLDLAPWSGRTLVDEFDLMLLLGLAAGFTRTPGARGTRMPDPALGAVLAMVGLAVAIGVTRTLLSWPGGSVESFSSPLSPLNALRIGKGALWALLLYALARRLSAAGRDVRPAFGAGMVAGLAGAVAVIVWERVVFAGLFDFADPYRVSGPFYAMHTGGAYVEAFIVMALPFAAAWLLEARAWPARAAALVLLAGAVYALAVTFSRGGYAAGALVVLMMALFAARARTRGRGSLAMAALLVAGSISVAYPIVSGPVASGRMSEAERDLGVRNAHWAQVWRLRDEGVQTMLLGMGLGSYPAARYWGSPEDRRPAVHRFETDGQVGRLRLGPGPGLYVDQMVSLPSGSPLRVEVQAASAEAGRLQVSLCQKWLLTSFECVGHVFEPGPGQPPLLVVELDGVSLASGAQLLERPLKFSLSNGGVTVIDVERVSLVASGRELLRNGNFAAGADRWSFTADDHLAWHVKTLPLAMMFELGVLGTLALAALLSLALLRSLRAAWGGSTRAAALAAATLGFLAVAVFDTVIDTPRFLMLMLCCGWLAAIGDPRQRASRPSRSRDPALIQDSRDTIRD